MRAPLFVPIALLLACSGDDADATDSGASGPAADVTCTAVVDGEPWEADPTRAFWNSHHADALSISCSLADSSSGILINIAGYTGPGTYALTEGQTYGQYLGGALSTEPGAWVSTTGSVEVTGDDGSVVRGTFAFDGTDTNLQTTKVVESGSFVLERE